MCEEKGTNDYYYDWCDYYDDQDCLDQYKYYHETFRFIDKDRNGMITFEELIDYHSEYYGEEQL